VHGFAPSRDRSFAVNRGSNARRLQQQFVAQGARDDATDVFSLDHRILLDICAEQFPANQRVNCSPDECPGLHGG
jgi:hypothetical protein